MPKYLMRFFVETALRADEDLRLRYRDHTLSLLFRSGNNTPKGIEVEIACEGQEYRAAGKFASEQLIPTVLDAVAFHRKTPLLLGGCTQVLKAEPGQDRRKIILVDVRRTGVTTRLPKEWVEHIQHILDCDSNLNRLPLRWLRNSYRPIGTLEKFIFTWLSLENLAGEKQIEKQCPHCHRLLPAYPAADWDAALDVLKAFDPKLDKKTLNGWRYQLRNPLFHGRQQPDVEFLGALNETMNQIQPAVESFLEKNLKVERRNPAAVAVSPERQHNVYYFLEFDTPYSGDEFSRIIPQLSRLIKLRESGRSVEEEMKCRTLGERHFENW